MSLNLVTLKKEKIKELLSSNNLGDESCIDQDIYRMAAVLVPFLIENGEWHLLFTRRTAQVEDHKDQVSFPGGSVDPEDESILQTALREANEEIGLDKNNVEILGSLHEFCTISNYRVKPIIGHIVWPMQITLSPSEVSRVFTVPLEWLTEPSHSTKRPFMDAGGEHRDVIFFQPYEDEIIWGITAQIVYELLYVLKLR
jgi:8-oxo-dGTP pyrophosphatase MutT (NUDIX family)